MDERERARKLAAGLTAARMYTCREVCDRLIRKGISRETAEAVTGEFLAAGVLDDTAYARLYIEDALRLKAKGMNRIRQELAQKGISWAVIDEAAAALAEEVDAGAMLTAYLAPRLDPAEIKSRRDLEKLKAKLVRRGYGLREIQDCLSAYDFHFEE